MDYESINKSLQALFDGVDYEMSNLSNASALLNEHLTDINWVGFYLYLDGKLILGPFQGKTACTEIAMGKGVCGSAAEKGEAIVVHDVHKFEGHIACDSASNSEIVLPIFKNGRLYGVLDIDSPVFCRFDENDLNGLRKTVKIIEEMLERVK